MKSVGIPLSSEYTTLMGREVHIVWVDISIYVNVILKEITFLLTKIKNSSIFFFILSVEKSCRQSESQKKTQAFSLCYYHSLSSFLKALNPRILQSPWNPGAQRAQAGQTEHGLNSFRASFLKNCLLILSCDAGQWQQVQLCQPSIRKGCSTVHCLSSHNVWGFGILADCLFVCLRQSLF